MNITQMYLINAEVSSIEAEEIQDLLESQPQRMLDAGILVSYTWDLGYGEHPVLDAILRFADENDMDFAEVHIFVNEDENE